MGVDWGLAGQIGGLGFTLVFVVLLVLALAVWLVGLIIGKATASKGETGNKKKGE
jgi:Na+-transporting methylmalonyl-CoA/oxaloacetate decarboxylase gamma subunit